MGATRSSGEGAPPTSGERIGERYLIKGTLGKGGFAQVLRVLDTTRGREVALKLLDPRAHAKVAALFELEYQTLAGLKHPRIVEVFEYGRDAQGAFYTMALLEGEDLKQRAPIPFREACSYLRDAAHALGLLHARRLLHRDVSPSNLWRTPDGRVTLIDFGALATFGPSKELIGTPPYVSPEAYHGRALDQRSDLYALGATGYFLLSGEQAYPAHALHALPALWERPVAPPSARVAELARSDLEPIPEPLDALIAALLSPEPLARPASTEELIDRLDAIIGPRASRLGEAGELRLSNAAFVGRAPELHTLRRMLSLAGSGRGQSCIVEAVAGLGSSRLLREVEVEAQLAAASVLHVEVARGAGGYALASQLALRLLDALPQHALSLAEGLAATLALVSPRLRERLGMPEGAPSESGVELKARLQDALQAWFARVAEQHTLVILVDGLELADRESLAVLLALAHRRTALRLLIVGTTRLVRREPPSAAERVLVSLSRRLVLRPLSALETLELLRSVFGEVEHLGRLAHRLQQVSQGNPEHLIELCDQLVRRDAIGFVAGAWVLPHEVPDAYLASSREEALMSRLGFVSAVARALGQVLSVHPVALPLESARALAGSVPGDLFAGLGELLGEGIVVRDESGVRFAHESLRLTLLAELAPERRRHVQRELGRWLLASEPGVIDRLRAGLYLLESGDPRGPNVVSEGCRVLTLLEEDKLLHALPTIEAALAIFRAQGRPSRELILLLAPLAIAGYYVDWRYAARYGDEIIALLSDFLGLSRARRLRRYLGRKLGLLSALLIAALAARLRKNARVPRFDDAFVLLFSCLATLAGTSTICVDPDRANRYAEVLEPLTALGPNHIASFMHEYCGALASTMRDMFGSTLARWRRLIARLESPEPIVGLPPLFVPRYLAGALFAAGSIESLRDDDESLRTAERLEQLNLTLCKLSADQIRSMHHANQGNLALFERYRERAEHHAIQLGTSWQTELWAPMRLITAYVPMHDVPGLKRVTAQLMRLSHEIPSLAEYVMRSQGAHAVLSGRPLEALPLLEPVLTQPPRMVAGWANWHGLLATAYNELHRHADARAVCERALAHVEPADLKMPAVNLRVQTELSIARAGLGELAEARAALDTLIALHLPNQGALTMGQLHEAGLRIALIAGDPAAARSHLEQTKHWYLPTSVPALLQHCESLERTVHGLDGSRDAGVASRAAVAEQEAAQRTLERLLGGGNMPIRERLETALQFVAERIGVLRALVFLVDDGGDPRSTPLTASLPDEPADPVVEAWALRRIAHERQLDEGHTQIGGALERVDSDLLVHAGWHYRIDLLLGGRESAPQVHGALVFAGRDASPPGCPPGLLHAIGRQLRGACQRERRTQTMSRSG